MLDLSPISTLHATTLFYSTDIPPQRASKGRSSHYCQLWRIQSQTSKQSLICLRSTDRIPLHDTSTMARDDQDTLVFSTTLNKSRGGRFELNRDKTVTVPNKDHQYSTDLFLGLATCSRPILRFKFHCERIGSAPYRSILYRCGQYCCFPCGANYNQ